VLRVAYYVSRITRYALEIDHENLMVTVEPAVAEGIYRLALSLGEMITGEHGVGATRRRYLPLALDAVQIDVMRQIRAVFDPNGILNPGKIFP
jgi:hypothetical protein